MMLFKLAWRNIWRNRRRTYITAASILFAVLFASFMDSLQRGAWDNMVRNVVNYYFGYMQVHEKGYWAEQSIDKAFILTDSLRQKAGAPPAAGVVPRIASFALAAGDAQATGVLVAGIEPEAEDEMTGLRERLIAGRYLSAEGKGALLASGVAGKLGLGVGDTLVLITQGFRGVNAAGKYPVTGLASFGSPELNKQMVYLPLQEAQYFFGAQGRVTSVAIHLEEADDIAVLKARLFQQLDTSAFEVMDWEEMLPDLVQARELDTAGNVIVYFILYLIIAFGIFGTILMMTKERSYEFGVLIAIGMQRWQLAWSVFIEIVMLGIIGALAGILASLPVVLYFKVNPIRFSGEMAGSLEKFGFEPIFPATFDPRIFAAQASYVFLATVVLAIYPMLKIRKLEPVRAMRG